MAYLNFQRDPDISILISQIKFQLFPAEVLLKTSKAIYIIHQFQGIIYFIPNQEHLKNGIYLVESAGLRSLQITMEIFGFQLKARLLVNIFPLQVNLATII